MQNEDHVLCAQAYAKLFARTGHETPTAMMDRLEVVGEFVVRRARVRLDCVACLLWRAFFAQTDLSQLHLILYIDGSPQRRGVELFAASVDVIVGSGALAFTRRLLLPVLSLGRQNMDAMNKTIALLWQLLLLVGPALLPRVLFRIKGILSDNGTERLP